jgi:hypothetical protein
MHPLREFQRKTTTGPESLYARPGSLPTRLDWAVRPSGDLRRGFCGR